MLAIGILLTPPIIETQVFGEEVHSYAKKSFHSYSLIEQLFSWSFRSVQKDHQDPEITLSGPQLPQPYCTEGVFIGTSTQIFLILLYLIASYGTRRFLECKDKKNQQDSNGADKWTGIR